MARPGARCSACSGRCRPKPAPGRPARRREGRPGALGASSWRSVRALWPCAASASKRRRLWVAPTTYRFRLSSSSRRSTNASPRIPAPGRGLAGNPRKVVAQALQQRLQCGGGQLREASGIVSAEYAEHVGQADLPIEGNGRVHACDPLRRGCATVFTGCRRCKAAGEISGEVAPELLGHRQRYHRRGLGAQHSRAEARGVETGRLRLLDLGIAQAAFGTHQEGQARRRRMAGQGRLLGAGPA